MYGEVEDVGWNVLAEYGRVYIWKAIILERVYRDEVVGRVVERL